MYDYLTGTISLKKPTQLVLDVGGVGYDLTISMGTYSQLPEVGEEAKILVYLNVKEDSMTLFGFSTVEERELFKLLISVSGIGPKLGVTILSGIGAEALQEAIQSKNITALTSISGIGKKTAERMVVELQEKVKTAGVKAGGASAFSTLEDELIDDALGAMISLGYKKADAAKAIDKVMQDSKERSLEAVIRDALNLVK